MWPWTGGDIDVSELLIQDGKLYASAWSIPRFLGIPGAGQVMTVEQKAFVPLRRS